MLGKILGIVGSLGIAASTFLDWGKLPLFGGSIKEGIDTIQGQIAIGAAVLALILMFVKPKFALVPALIALSSAVWFFLKINGSPIKPGTGLWVAIGCSVLVAVGGYMVSSKSKR